MISNTSFAVQLGSGVRSASAPVWFFDLDNTLHDASHAIFPQINERMTAFVAKSLSVDLQEAGRLRHFYWRRYGATLLGLLRHHAVDAQEFLHYTHDFDVRALLRAEPGLVRLFTQLPGRKVLLTNAPAGYAAAVVRELSLRSRLSAHYAVESMRIHGRYRPKPSISMLLAILAREKIPASQAVLVEDNLVNCKAAKRAGFRTIWVTGHDRGGGAALTARPAYVDLRVSSVRELPRRWAFMRA